MLILVSLTIVSIIILTFGFLGIRLPLIHPGKRNPADPAQQKQEQHHFKMDERIIKDSVKETLKTSRFFREKVFEKSTS